MIMKAIFYGMALLTGLSACNNNTPTTAEKKADTVTTGSQAGNTTTQPAPAGEIINAYIQLKNALADDNSSRAADAGKNLSAAIENIQTGSLTAAQKKVYEDVIEDMNEHAEHIVHNADNIKHQREHFETLSKDLYDLTKVIKPSQTLYHDFCPMYNEGNGAAWISEAKEIRNPYLGKEMLECGKIKEEIK
jgi:hypothetical protein